MRSIAVLVVDPPEPLGRDDLGGAAAGAVHLLEDVLGDRAGDRALVDQRDQLGQRVRRRAATSLDRSRASRSACASAPPSPSCSRPSGCRRRRRRARSSRRAPSTASARRRRTRAGGTARRSARAAPRAAPAACARIVFDPRRVDDERRQVRLGEVAVVVRFLLRPHHASCGRPPDPRAASPGRAACRRGAPARGARSRTRARAARGGTSSGS